MARRHKVRTHTASAQEPEEGVPKSMVIKMGDPKRKPTRTLAALVRDFRQAMQPHTAAKLKERKSNKLKDYLVMAGPLGVTHFFIFSQTSSGNTTMRIARTPRGPTLYFRVNQYSLSSDIHRSQTRPHALTPQSPELRNPPVLVMNNFSSAKTSDMDALLTSMFQNMLPTINVDANTSLGGVRRVLLLNRIPETDEIELRHYAVVTRVVGSSKAVKKINAISRGQKAIPDLHNLQSVAQYMVDPSLSDSEGEDEVVPAGSSPSLPAAAKVKKAVKLVEVGPRMNLTLLKIEDGLCSGKTLYHSIEKRSNQEARALEKQHQDRDVQRERRRKEQEANVQRKREAAAAKTSRSKRGAERARLRSQEEERASDMDDSDGDVDADNVEDMNDYELEAELAHGAQTESEDENQEESDDQ